MPFKYQFAILKFQSGSPRNEEINVGLVSFPTGNIDIRLHPSPSRQAIIDEFDATRELRFLEKTLRFLLPSSALSNPQEVLDALESLPRWRPSGLGYFHASNKEEYEREINELLDELVKPAARPKRSTGKRRLVADVRDEISKMGVLGKTERDFHNGYVVPNFQIPLGESHLRFDFAVSGKRIMLVQTLDLYNAESVDKAKDASFKALALDHARNWWFQEAHTFFVIRVPGVESQASRMCMEIMHAYADNVVDFGNDRQRVEFLVHLSRFRNRTRDLFKPSRQSPPKKSNSL